MSRVLVLLLVFVASFPVLAGCAVNLEGGAEAERAGDPAAGGSTASGGATRAAADQSSGGRVETCDGGTIRLNAQEKRTVELHNEVRRERDLEPLCVQRALTEAARVHSREMIRKDYFSHESYGGASLVERLRRHGYTTGGYRSWRVAGNIAWGNGSYGTPEHIFDGWMASESHRPHILSGEFRQIGVGTYTGKYKDYRGATAYTAEFGVRRR